MSAITSNQVYLVDTMLNKRVEDLVSIEAPSARSQYGATEFVNIFDILRFKFNPVVLSRIEAFVAPLYSPNFSRLIVIVETHHDFSNNYI